jgi:hypothetical protein
MLFIIRDAFGENRDEAFEFGRHVLVHGLRPGVHSHEAVDGEGHLLGQREGEV